MIFANLALNCITLKSFNLLGHEKYMQRCIELAQLGAGKVSRNPIVGGLIVDYDKIIGECDQDLFGQEVKDIYE